MSPESNPARSQAIKRTWIDVDIGDGVTLRESSCTMQSQYAQEDCAAPSRGADSIAGPHHLPMTRIKMIVSSKSTVKQKPIITGL